MLTGLFFLALIALAAIPASLISDAICKHYREKEKALMRAQAKADMEAMNVLYNKLIIEEVMRSGEN